MTQHIDTRLARRRSIEFDTVADMVAASFLVVGQLVVTKEYAAGKDGGNRYEIVAAATGTANAGSFIDVTGPDTPVQAKALWYNNLPSLPQYGADPTGAVDATTRIQAAFDSISNQEFRVLDMGNTGNGGFYNCSATLFTPNKVFNITGRGDSQSAGGHSTVFRFNMTDLSNCFEFVLITDTSDVNFSSFILGDFFVQGQNQGGGVGTGNGIECAVGSGGFGNATIRNIYSRRHVGNGFNFDEMFICRFPGLRASLCSIGINMLRCNECRGTHLVDATEKDGIVIDGGRANKLEGNIDNTGLDALADYAMLTLKNVQDSEFLYYSESGSSPLSTITTTAMDDECRNNRVHYYSTNRNVYVDKGIDNVINGVTDRFLKLSEVSKNLTSPNFAEGPVPTLNWAPSGDMGALSVVVEEGKQWIKGTHAAGAGTIFVIDTANFSDYQIRAFAGDQLTVQFTIKASRDAEFGKIGEEEFILDPIGGGSTAFLTNLYSRHFENFTVSTKSKTFRMVFDVVQDIGNLAFRIVTTDILSSIDLQLTDIIWATNVTEKIYTTKTATVATDNRYVKGDVLAVQDSADAADVVWCDKSGFAPSLTWAATTAFAQGDLVNITSTVAICTVAGTSGGSAPAMPGIGVSDGSCTWDAVEPLATFTTAHP